MTEQNTKTKEKALRLRKQMKQRKPSFVRPESWRYVRLKENWRRPRGLDHKMRIKYDGWPPAVSIGYRGPKASRGLHPSGYKELLVHNTEELSKVDTKTQAIRIAHTVGKRKRTMILAEAKRKRIVTLNIKERAAREESTEKEKETEEPPKSEHGQEKTKKRKKETEEQ